MAAEPRLRPREHGAYAMLAFPCVSGLVLGGLSWPGVAVVSAAVSGFLAHESALILLGARGARVHAAQGSQARSRLLSLGAVTLLATVVFAATAPAAAWPPAAVTAVLAAGVGVLLLTGRTKTLPGELLVAAAFASVHGVVAGSGWAGRGAVYLPVAAWTASFALATLAVHALKYRFKGRGPGKWTVWAAPALAVAAVAAAIAAVVDGVGGGPVLLAFVPKGLLVLGLAVATVHPRHLKRVGWSLVVADVLTLSILGWAFV